MFLTRQHGPGVPNVRRRARILATRRIRRPLVVLPPRVIAGWGKMSVQVRLGVGWTEQNVIAQPWSNKEPTGESAFWIA